MSNLEATAVGQVVACVPAIPDDIRRMLVKSDLAVLGKVADVAYAVQQARRLAVRGVSVAQQEAHNITPNFATVRELYAEHIRSWSGRSGDEIPADDTLAVEEHMHERMVGRWQTSTDAVVPPKIAMRTLHPDMGSPEETEQRQRVATDILTGATDGDTALSQSAVAAGLATLDHAETVEGLELRRYRIHIALANVGSQFTSLAEVADWKQAEIDALPFRTRVDMLSMLREIIPPSYYGYTGEIRVSGDTYVVLQDAGRVMDAARKARDMEADCLGVPTSRLKLFDTGLRELVSTLQDVRQKSIAVPGAQESSMANMLLQLKYLADELLSVRSSVETEKREVQRDISLGLFAMNALLEAIRLQKNA